MTIINGTGKEVAITRVSTSSDGAQGAGASYGAAFLADGSGIAFYSFAPDLAQDDTNATADIFIKTFATGVTTRVTTEDPAGTGTAATAPGDFLLLGSFPRFSADGTQLAFFADDAAKVVTGDTNGFVDLFVKNLTTGITTLVTHGLAGAQANNKSYFPDISPDGTKVVFQSLATNLVAGDTNRSADIFLADLATGAITRISTTSAGVAAARGSALPQFSPDGTKVVFQSLGSLAAADTDTTQDVYVKDLPSGAVTLVSVSEGGLLANDDATHGVFSPDGTRVMFESGASNLVAGDGNGAVDIFIKDLTTGAVMLVSSASDGSPGNGNSTHAEFSHDGMKVVFQSFASNFITGDGNNTSDVFIKDLATGTLTAVSVNDAGQVVPGSSNHPVFSADDQFVAFTSSAARLVGGDTNAASDVLMRKLGPLGDGADVLAGTSGNDEIHGLSGNDTLTGNAGNDILDGGADIDTASYAGAASLVKVNLAFTVAQNTVGDGSDTLISIENLIGSAFDDTLTGNGVTNRLEGADGNDRLFGGAGNDVMTGGAGADQMTGGTGADTFAFGSLTDSLASAAGRDRILDFSHTDGDRIDVSAIDAIAGGADDTFHLVTRFTRHAGELMQTGSASGIVVQGDVDGDGRGDFSIFVAGTTLLIAGDFIL